MAGLDLRQQQKLTQQLVMTQQLQQAIKLLQLNHLELVEHVQTELLENPTLEEIPGTRVEVSSDGEDRLRSDAAAQGQDVVEQNNGSQEGTVDWGQVLEEYSSASAFKTGSGAGNYDELPPIESTLRTSESLADHLVWQLGLAECTEPERRAGMTVIHNLDHRGWLEATLEQIADEADTDLETAERGRKLVQTFDPPGCGSRDLIECLVVQARVHWPEDPMVVRILSEHLSDLETRNYAAIAKALELEAMPMPKRAGFLARRRIAELRQGVAALARAFAHRCTAADLPTLDRAASASPLLHWAMRYAAAIVAIDLGRVEQARGMLADAPTWPAESAFRAFHDQITARLTAP